jgi:ferredoxin
MTAGWRVEVIRERCLSTANCVATAPGFFDLDEDGIATVTGEAGGGAGAGTGPELEERVKNAVAECPAVALRLVRGVGDHGPGRPAAPGTAG